MPHAQRAPRTTTLLARLAQIMGQAGDLEQIRQAAADTEHLIREENSACFGVMRFHDIELIACAGVLSRTRRPARATQFFVFLLGEPRGEPMRAADGRC